MSEHPHDRHAPHAHDAKDRPRARAAIFTVSDTRTLADDEGGALAAELVQAAGHELVRRAIVKDDVDAIRAKSWGQVGPRAVLSRALAGTAGRALIVALPGSPKAVRLALEEVLLPLVPHALGLLRG